MSKFPEKPKEYFSHGSIGFYPAIEVERYMKEVDAWLAELRTKLEKTIEQDKSKDSEYISGQEDLAEEILEMLE